MNNNCQKKKPKRRKTAKVERILDCDKKKFEKVISLSQKKVLEYRWICNTKLTDNLSTDLLIKRLGIYGIEECLRLRRLRWYGCQKSQLLYKPCL